MFENVGVESDDVESDAGALGRSGTVDDVETSGMSEVTPLADSIYAGGGLHFSHCPSLEWTAVMILSCIEVRYRSPSSHFSVTTSTLCPQARYCVCSK